jgi:ABC-2 type transport system permease protein
METKKIKNRSELLIYILVILGFIGVINFLATKWFGRIDMTQAKEYSISKPTKTILKNLDDILNVQVFFSKNLPPNLHNTVTNVKDILAEYKAYGGKNVKITWKDPAESDSIKQLARSFGIPEVQLQTFEKDKQQLINGYLGIAILYETKKEVIPVVQNLDNLEYDLTLAIMKVSRKSIPKVGILKMDTIPPIPPQYRNQMKGGPQGTEEKFAGLYENLRNNYDVTTVDISSGTPIDSSIKTLVIPGLASISDRKAFEIDQYFMHGGNLIVLADAVQVNFQYGINAVPQESKILDLLEKYGVRVEKNLVLDASCGQVSVPQNFGPIQVPVAVPYPYFVRVGQDGFDRKNPAVSPLSNLILPWTSSLTLLVDKADTTGKAKKVDQKKVTGQILVRSSQKSWTASGYFDLNPQQKWAPAESTFKQQNLVAYLSGSFNSYFEGKTVPPVNGTNDTLNKINLNANVQDANRQIVNSNSKGHLVVIGDAEFVAGQNAQNPPNVMLVQNLVDWLTLDDNLISIRARTMKDRTIDADLIKEGSSKPNIIRVVNFIFMPAILVLIGFMIFVRRREIIAPSAPIVSQEKQEEKK